MVFLSSPLYSSASFSSATSTISTTSTDSGRKYLSFWEWLSLILGFRIAINVNDYTELPSGQKIHAKIVQIGPEGVLLCPNAYKVSVSALFENKGVFSVTASPQMQLPKVFARYPGHADFRINLRGPFKNSGLLRANYQTADLFAKIFLGSSRDFRNEGTITAGAKGSRHKCKIHKKYAGIHCTDHDVVFQTKGLFLNSGIIMVTGTQGDPVSMNVRLDDLVTRHRTKASGSICLQFAVWNLDIPFSGGGCIVILPGSQLILHGNLGLTVVQTIRMTPGDSPSELVYVPTDTPILTIVSVSGFRKGTVIRFNPPMSSFKYVDDVIQMYYTDLFAILMIRVERGLEAAKMIFDQHTLTYASKRTDPAPPSCRCVGEGI